MSQVNILPLTSGNRNKKFQLYLLYIMNIEFTSIARSMLNIENDIEKKIQSEVWQKGIRIREFFFDFDRLRKGVVSEDKVDFQSSFVKKYIFIV